VARFSDQYLRLRALAVLEDALARATRAALEREPALAFALTYLGNSATDRTSFDAFWRALSIEQHAERYQVANTYLNGIYASVGVTRESKWMCRRVKFRMKPLPVRPMPGTFRGWREPETEKAADAEAPAAFPDATRQDEIMSSPARREAPLDTE